MGTGKRETLRQAGTPYWLAVVVVAASVGTAADWPEWRGPARDSHSTETGWFDKWQPEPLWETDVGLGQSSVAVADGRLYVCGLTEVFEDHWEDVVYCLDADTGQEIWRHTFPAAPPGHELWPGARATPTVHGTNVYLHHRDGDVRCLNAVTGALQWRNNTSSSGRPGFGGFAGSPCVEGDLLLIQSGAHGCALNRFTGAEVWNHPATNGEIVAWSSPVVTSWSGQRVWVMQTVRKLHLVDVATGNVIGSYDCMNTQKCADPIVWSNAVFISHSDDGWGDRWSDPSDGPVSRLVQMGTGMMAAAWTDGDLTAECHTPVLVGNHVYGVSYASADYLLMCVDMATGKAVWTRDMDEAIVPPPETAESGEMMMTAADGYLFVMSAARNQSAGRLLIVRATPDGYDDGGRESFEVTENAALHDWYGHPVLVDGLLYLRGSGYDAPLGSEEWTSGKVVCLRLAGTPTDWDGDGMGDVWEQEMLESILPRATDDSDGDGVDNLGEYLAGTDPVDSSDVPRLELITEDGSLVLRCPTDAAGGNGYDESRQRHYTIECRTNLLHGQWLPLAGAESRVGDGMPWVVSNRTSDLSGYYRLKVGLE